ncbi:MAG: cytochrome c oxidase subunit II [Planctomycetaceae bacterium]|nr:cytochrome c oxidase subunit II [Planctomycetaceae bacterium]
MMLNLLDNILYPLAATIAQSDAPVTDAVVAAEDVPEAVGRPVRELGGTFWLPDAGSTLAPGIDWAFMAITWLCYICFAGIVFVLVYFTWKYRQKGTELNYQADAPTHNTAMEVGWTVIPMLICIAIFFMGFKGFLDLTTPPKDSYEVQVVAQKWGWDFKYPNGATDDNLIVPVGQPVKLIMRSNDVLHSLYIPDFRVKQDVVPGRYSYLWFQADEVAGFPESDTSVETGHYLFCTEYCGTGHSNMNRLVYVLPQDAFEEWEEKKARWLDDVPDEDLYAVAGPILYGKCSQCHSVDGGANTGPSWGDPTSGSLAGLGDLWKRTVAGTSPVTGGTKGKPGTTLADYIGEGKLYGTPEDYIRASIYNPGEILVGGYGPNMPHFKGQVNDVGIDALIGMMRHLEDFDAAGKYTKTLPSELAEESGGTEPEVNPAG